MSTTSLSDLLSTDQAAALAGLEPDTIRHYLENGRLRGIKLGRSWVIRRSDLERFLRRPREVGRPAKT